MEDFYNSSLIQSIKDKIKTNNNKGITGNILQEELLKIIGALDLGGMFLGFASKSTNPGNEGKSRANGFYFSTEEGTYTNFIGRDNQPLVIGSDLEIIYREVVNDTLTWNHRSIASQFSVSGEENNFASFDGNGGLQDSGYNKDSFIQGIKQNNTPLTPDSDGIVNITVTNGEDGDSAYQIWLDENNYDEATHPVSEFLASLKANIGAFQFITQTDTTAEAALTAIGRTYANAIGGVSPSQSTLSVILLMNDSNNTKTMMIATQDDGNGGFEFVYAGDLQGAMPSNVVTADKIDNSFAGGSGMVAGAEEVKAATEQMFRVGFGTPIELTKTVNQIVNWNTGRKAGGGSTRYNTYEVSVSENDGYVYFVYYKATTNTVIAAVAFLDSNDDMIRASSIQGGEGISWVGKIFEVPTNASTLIITEYSADLNNPPVPSIRRIKRVGNQKIANGSVTSEKIADNSITTNKISDGAVTGEKIANNSISNDKLADFKLERTYNLFDKNTMIDDGHYLNNNGAYMQASNWACSTLIEIEPETSYYFHAKTWGRSTGYVWYDDTQTAIEPRYGSSTIEGIHVSPQNAKYVRFNLNSSTTNVSIDVIVAKSTVPVPYIGYYAIPASSVSGLDEVVKEEMSASNNKSVKVTVDGNTLRLDKGSDYITAVLVKNIENSTVNNPNFNFTGGKINNVTMYGLDDVAPIHAFNTTIGANHGQVCYIATIANHGLENSDLGSAWVHSNGKTYYIIKIIDASSVKMISANEGTYRSPSFAALTSGNITKDGTTLTISSVTQSQWYPSIKNKTIKIYGDGIELSDGVSYADNIDVVEVYEIMNPASMVQYVIDNSGSEDVLDVDGNSAIRVQNVYKFDKNLNNVVVTTYYFLEEAKMSDVMVTQKEMLGGGGTVQYYIPNSLPINNGNIDLRQPSSVTWSSSLTDMSISEQKCRDANHPVNRVLQYTNGLGVSIGYIIDKASGANILNFTNTIFELRNNTGKIYPHPVSGVVGTDSIVPQGRVYSTVLYKSHFNPIAIGNRLSMYHFNYNGAEYVFVDYSGSMLDKVEVDSSLNGKKITVLESVNASLVDMVGKTTDLPNNIYNDSFYVNAEYNSTDKTCFIVVKIE